ncbi:hypothetical protein [Ottowia sp.]|uniref:hypothetical protein n=1 Tax=Ottowia sp. TaxID=1898956 RepID=UPI003A8AB8E7
MTAFLGACSSGPPVPDWSLSAHGHVERARVAWLRGQDRVAAREFDLARADMARTGRPELVARVELNRCAVRVAALDFDDCPGFAPLAADVTEAERAYVAYLQGQTTPAQAALLTEAQRAVAGGRASLGGAQDAVSQLVAAGVLFRQGQATPEVVAQAAEIASHQGWPRALLAWLGVQLRLAEQRGDAQEAARLRRRMDLVAPADKRLAAP